MSQSTRILAYLKRGPKPKQLDSDSESNSAPTLKELGIDLKTSMRAEAALKYFCGICWGKLRERGLHHA